MTKILTIIAILFAATTVSMSASPATAQFYNGDGLQSGIEQSQNDVNINTDEPYTIIEKILRAILSVVGILAVVAIVIAGLILLVGGVDDGQRSRAFRAILNVILGLIVIGLASAFVTWLASLI